jgi:hypothetical protein
MPIARSAKPSKFPVHDQKRDGSPFPWIIRVAAELRAHRQAADSIDRVRFREARMRWVPRDDGD